MYSKLAGIEPGANKYIHPENMNTRHVTDAEKTRWNSAPLCAFSLSQSGWAKIGTFMIVWGKATNVPANSNTSVRFAASFTTCYNVHVTMETSDPADSQEIGVNSITPTGFVVMNGEGRIRSIYYVAFGSCII